MDDEEILEKLESLLDDDRLENGFETKGELLEWANAVAPLLRFHDEYYRTFQHYNRIINRNVSYVTGEPAFRTMVSQAQMAAEWLRSNEAFEEEDEPQQHDEDIVDVKPNFMGLGLNLNAAWKRFKNRKK